MNLSSSRVELTRPSLGLTFLLTPGPKRKLIQYCAGVVTLIGLVQALSLSQEPLRPLLVQDAPRIDGRLDDAAWTFAPSVSGFKTYAPDYGKDLLGETIVRMAYDTRNLFFAFECRDAEPHQIKASMTSRDKIANDDWVCINLDSFGDQQSLYAFYINPLGIQGDSRFAANQEDFSFDCVWYSAGSVDERGYVLEVQLPLKSIRYSSGDTVQMRVVFERRISRRSEQGTFPPLSPQQAMAFLTQMYPIVYAGIEEHTLLELLPALTYGQREAANSGLLALTEKRSEASLTAKYGLTSDLILDATVNPDFSQVEADAGQVDVNLRYALFYPEKRLFFLEGSESFTVGATSSSSVDPLKAVVYTRTIVDPLVGVKLTGKIDPRNSLALLYAADEYAGELSPGTTGITHVPILRYKHSLADDSFVGLIYAGREKASHYNRAGGTDGELRLGESTMLSFHALYAESRQDQTSDRRAGHALGASVQHNTRDLGLAGSLKEISEAFSVETGYVTRTGVSILALSMTPRYYPESELLRRVSVGLSSAQTRDHPSGLWETSNSADVSLLIGGATMVRPEYVYSTEIFLGERFLTGGVGVTARSQVFKELLVQGSLRTGYAIFYSSDPYQGTSTSALADVTFQPWDDLTFELTYQYSDFYRSEDSQRIYEISISRSKLTYQLNRYLFFRGTVEYNTYDRSLLTDLLASFTYIPGTVFHVGYGSAYERVRWERDAYLPDARLLETQRAFFLKASYLWQL